MQINLHIQGVPFLMMTSNISKNVEDKHSVTVSYYTALPSKNFRTLALYIAELYIQNVCKHYFLLCIRKLSFLYSFSCHLLFVKKIYNCYIGNQLQDCD